MPGLRELELHVKNLPEDIREQIIDIELAMFFTSHNQNDLPVAYDHFCEALSYELTK